MKFITVLAIPTNNQTFKKQHVKLNTDKILLLKESKDSLGVYDRVKIYDVNENLYEWCGTIEDLIKQLENV